MSSTAAQRRIEDAAVRCPMSKSGRLAKRMIDIMGSVLLLLAFAPVIAVIALFIKAWDRGPVIYRRRVVGRKGEFDAFKLRSMRVDADRLLQCDPVLRAEFEQNFKLRNDPRITPVGRVIRKLSLDELPQLFNVLAGQMSLVGPRMIVPEEMERFGEGRDIFRQMKPGMTGYWQVHARQQVSYRERVEMEMFYVRNWSLLLDMRILLLTPFRVLQGVGAW